MPDAPITTDKVADAHLYEGEATLKQNATATEKGSKTVPCVHCDSETLVYFTPKACDADGNDVIDISDVTAMLQYLAGSKSESEIACDVDLNSDGRSNISDITKLLYILGKQ